MTKPRDNDAQPPATELKSAPIAAGLSTDREAEIRKLADEIIAEHREVLDELAK